MIENSKMDFYFVASSIYPCSRSDQIRFVFMQLLKNIGSTSPECLFYPHLTLNEPAPPPYPLNEDMEQSLMEAIRIQREREEEFCENALDDPRFRFLVDFLLKNINSKLT